MSRAYLAALSMAFLFYWLRPIMRRGWVMWLGVQLAAAVVVEAAAVEQDGVPNHWLYNLYMFVEFLAITAMVSSLCPMHNRLRSWVPWSMLPFTIAYLYDVNDSFDRLATDALVIGGLMLLMMNAGLLVHEAATGERAFWYSPSAWLCLSTIVYFGCAAPFMGVLHFLNNIDLNATNTLYAVNDMASIVRYLLIALCILLLPRRHRLAHDQ